MPPYSKRGFEALSCTKASIQLVPGSGEGQNMPILFDASVMFREGDGPPIKATGCRAFARGLIRGLCHIAILYFRDHVSARPPAAQLGVGFVRPLHLHPDNVGVHAA